MLSCGHGWGVDSWCSQWWLFTGIGVVFTTFLILLGIPVKEVVLVWYCFWLFWLFGKRRPAVVHIENQWKWHPLALKMSKFCAKPALKSAKTSRKTQFWLHGSCVACGTLLRRIETIFIENFEILATYEVTLEKMASDGSGIQYHFLIVLGNEFWFRWGPIPVNKHHCPPGGIFFVSAVLCEFSAPLFAWMLSSRGQVL